MVGGLFTVGRPPGRILSGGTDCAITRGDGVLELDVRTILEAGDGALIDVTYTGVRHGPDDVIAGLGRERVDPSAYYFRIVPRFETSAPAAD